MNPLVIQPTAETPLVDFNRETGQLRIEGRSWPENVSGFYSPLLQWLNEYVTCPKTETTFSVTLEYFNSTSSKMIFQFLMTLRDAAEKGNKVTVLWHYLFDDEEMLDMGKEYLAALPSTSDLFQFNFVCIDENPN